MENYIFRMSSDEFEEMDYGAPINVLHHSSEKIEERLGREDFDLSTIRLSLGAVRKDFDAKEAVR